MLVVAEIGDGRYAQEVTVYRKGNLDKPLFYRADKDFPIILQVPRPRFTWSLQQESSQPVNLAQIEQLRNVATTIYERIQRSKPTVPLSGKSW
jgi:hypothetical protein